MIKNNTNPKTILVLERDEPFREILIEMLTLEGYMVHSAENGSLGIQSAKIKLPDLILCASSFADISCWEIFKNLKREKSTRHIPFVCLSSRPLQDEDFPIRVIVLTKPFETKKLLDTINECFSLKKSKNFLLTKVDRDL